MTRTMAWKLLAVVLALFVGAAQAGPGDPLGAPFVISTPDNEGIPAVARDGAGNFLVAWAQHPGIQARRYYADGTPQGPDFTLISPLETRVGAVRLAMNAAGDFVAMWGEYSLAGERRFYVRSFRADGTPRSPALIPGQFSQGKGAAHMAMNADGRFVVLWSDIYHLYGPPLGDFGGLPSVGLTRLYARRYEPDGTTSQGSTLVGTSVLSPTPIYGSYDSVSPAVAMDAQGGFVAVWQDNAISGKSVLYQRRYKADGKAAGLKTNVDPDAASSTAPVVAMDAAGNALIAWHTSHPISSNSYSGYDLWLRRFPASGTAAPAFRVMESGIDIMNLPALAMIPDGRAAIAWIGSPSNSCCTPQELNLQTYAADGSPQGGKRTLREMEFGFNQLPPGVAMDGYGNPVVLWMERDVLMGQRMQAH